jgi:sugar lactone lactonase YvrE
MKSFPLLVCLWLAATAHVSAQTYTWSTIAGLAGSAGGVDGTNGAIRFNNPSGLALDGAGNLYIADMRNHTIRKLRPNGAEWVAATLAGSAGLKGAADGVGTNALFSQPKGVAVDSGTTLFIVDYANHTIRRAASDGKDWIVSTIAGLAGTKGGDDGYGSQARFSGPIGIATGPSTNLYVADTVNSTIREVSFDGVDWFTRTIAGTAEFYGFTNDVGIYAEFAFPYSVTVDAHANLYVADWGNHAIRQLTFDGTDWVVTTIAGLSGAPGNSDGPGGTAQFNAPNGIAVDRRGNLFVTDQSNHAIRKLSRIGADWLVTTIGGMPLQAGSADGAGAEARFKNPYGIAVDDAGVVYVSDFGNHTIRRGVPSAVAAPALAVTLVAGQVLVSWPVSAAEYTLETRGSLEPPSSWTAATNQPSISGDNLVVTNLPSVEAAFYRLRK